MVRIVNVNYRLKKIGILTKHELPLSQPDA